MQMMSFVETCLTNKKCTFRKKDQLMYHYFYHTYKSGRLLYANNISSFV